MTIMRICDNCGATIGPAETAKTPSLSFRHSEQHQKSGKWPEVTVSVRPVSDEIHICQNCINEAFGGKA